MFWHSVALNCEVRSSWNLNSTEFLCLFLLQASLKKIWLKMNIIFSTTQGHVIPKCLIRSGLSSNLSEVLCLSSLPVCLMEIEFRVTEKRWTRHFLQYNSMGGWGGGEFSAQGRITPKWIIRPGPNSNSFPAFMPVLVTCKFDKYLIKVDWEKLETSFFWPLKGT